MKPQAKSNAPMLDMPEERSITRLAFSKRTPGAAARAVRWWRTSRREDGVRNQLCTLVIFRPGAFKLRAKRGYTRTANRKEKYTLHRSIAHALMSRRKSNRFDSNRNGTKRNVSERWTWFGRERANSGGGEGEGGRIESLWVCRRRSVGTRAFWAPELNRRGTLEPNFTRAL